MIEKHEGMNPEDSDDVAVITRVLRGQTDEFAILLNRYQGYVCKVVSSYLPYDLVEELAHEIFIEAFRSLPKFDQRKVFRKWLAGIATIQCYEYWRRHYRNREIPLSAITEDHQDWLDGVVASQATDSFFSREKQKEAREILQVALACLSLKDRLVLTLVHLEDHSIKEAAEILGWSSINVRVRVHRAREKMRRSIAALSAGGTRK